MPTSLPQAPAQRPAAPLEVLAVLITLVFVGLALSAAVAPAALSSALEYVFRPVSL
jgi:hypothetical protein